ncbi:LOW QUALITY PROTEIN: hypothetical protein ACHAXR_008584 [Thalassiosira sp. AJA248-18]
MGNGIDAELPHLQDQKDVAVHGFRDNHFGRLVVGLEENYYVISRRYLCKCCRDEKEKLKKSVETFATQSDVDVSVENVKVKYTFMGWDMQSMPLFADGRGDQFPAFFTWKAGGDKLLINLMRPLFDAGIRQETFSDLLLELHSKKHTQRHLDHEREFAREALQQECNDGFLLHLQNYNGSVPTGRYIAHVYKLYHSSIRAHLDNEAKKRGAETLHWDVSYKEAKNLCQFRGRPIYHGLVTALNEFGEVRIQLHVFTDGHDQMKPALQAFAATKTSSQRGLNRSSKCWTHETANLPEPVYDPGFTKIASTSPDINDAISALRETLGEKKVDGLDCEWKVVFRRRNTGGQDKVALLQLSYIDSEGQMRVLLLMLYRLNMLDKSIKCVGVNVSGDLRKVGRDFQIIVEEMNRRIGANVVNLGKFARVRAVVQNGSVGMEKLCKMF